MHYSNLGEIECYGAYLDGYDMPFAYSSYGSINYNYTKEMLEYMGFSPDKIIESSRAWNAIWAPENTMSVLFAYSHDRLKEKINGLEGIITSINPNLGFSASAFRGVHFIISPFCRQWNTYICIVRKIAKNFYRCPSTIFTIGNDIYPSLVQGGDIYFVKISLLLPS